MVFFCVYDVVDHNRLPNAPECPYLLEIKEKVRDIQRREKSPRKAENEIENRKMPILLISQHKHVKNLEINALNL